MCSVRLHVVTRPDETVAPAGQAVSPKIWPPTQPWARCRFLVDAVLDQPFDRETAFVRERLRIERSRRIAAVCAAREVNEAKLRESLPEYAGDEIEIRLECKRIVGKRTPWIRDRLLQPYRLNLFRRHAGRCQNGVDSVPVWSRGTVDDVRRLVGFCPVDDYQARVLDGRGVRSVLERREFVPGVGHPNREQNDLPARGGAAVTRTRRDKRCGAPAERQVIRRGCVRTVWVQASLRTMIGPVAEVDQRSKSDGRARAVREGRDRPAASGACSSTRDGPRGRKRTEHEGGDDPIESSPGAEHVVVSFP